MGRPAPWGGFRAGGIVPCPRRGRGRDAMMAPLWGPCIPGADMPAARLLRLIGLRPFRRRPAWRGAASGWGPAVWAGRGLRRGGVSPFARRGPSPSACLMRAGTLSDDGHAGGVFLLRHVRGWRLASRFMRSRRSSSVSRHWRRVFSGVSMPWLAAWWCQRTVWARLEALCARTPRLFFLSVSAGMRGIGRMRPWWRP